MATVRLNRGTVVWLDDADVPLVVGRTWSAVRSRNGWYVSTRINGRTAYTEHCGEYARVNEVPA